MFSKLLIANRGEIACRIIKTARRLGLRTVAVYSQADAGARHVRLADEAICIGEAAARESYLSIDKIVAAAVASGAQAIHPGYGFLSENEQFAAACQAHGVVFIGPPVAAIRAMGSKSEARKLMEKAGVPLTPGYHGDLQDEAHLQRQAATIGYPVLIKAAAGGGGKGMRVVTQAEEFAAALASCRREAGAYFGSEHVLIEKYLQRPRHIEIQVFGDRHGNYVHLFERDCSVQRRHQKVVEEAPAPGMTSARRAAMGQAAVEAARAVGYVGAGTVEFIVEPGGAFYFMEMNTRLQVEHPVTEMITGVDLVEWQLKVGAGETVPLRQEQLTIKGCALEARIYAEDPDRGFLPSIGRLIHWSPPQESLHVRVDTGVEQGDEVTPHYDPMLAKLIVWDESRERAVARMLQALADYRVAGVTTNIAFLSRLVACPAFANADLDTGLIEREQSYLFPAQVAPPREAWLIAALADLLRDREHAWGEAAHSNDPYSPWHQRDGWCIGGGGRRAICLRVGEIEKTVTARYVSQGFALELDGGVTQATAQTLPSGALRIDLGGRRLNATVAAAGEKRHVFFDGMSFVFAAIDPLFHAGSSGGGEGGLTAPMPGKVIALLAEVGASVAKGAPLMILEAMKMEHVLSAPADGKVKSFRFMVGEQVTDGAELVEFEVD
ncbi:MAG: 3-methylcrotonyl-CoA carboxylase [Candidatus Handelsmanbacteria bacterium RIFCSPLOWO2_12_FULL_64_10]|uniref:3-methylcrotonyl-CoA carboxylase n=1 Tax=Handelsmanbacteria sp. (strain RIFCSPLOWO2_12_FULL_64_10) TaxID=1817868 RepID=A0A1F6C5E4_HANXR|nr:MAG: 3-methylcrotonyl-CoA carboxylase [Candidatus Handelsmanbacteria bacterium RIFCSPLOWO2_12_FULL_64_10]